MNAERFGGIGQLTPRQALRLALGWVVIVVAFPLVRWGATAAHRLWLDRNTDPEMTVSVAIRVTSWPMLAAIVLLPPLLFLGVWRFARR